jgi:hypothetical protein
MISFSPDPPPPAGLVYILNSPSVCVSVPRENSMIEWLNLKVDWQTTTQLAH